MCPKLAHRPPFVSLVIAPPPKSLLFASPIAGRLHDLSCICVLRLVGNAHAHGSSNRLNLHLTPLSPWAQGCNSYRKTFFTRHCQIQTLRGPKERNTHCGTLSKKRRRRIAYPPDCLSKSVCAPFRPPLSSS